MVGACDRGGPRPSRVPASQQLPPYGKGVDTGSSYEYVLLTHCGIQGAQIDGMWWVADPPLGDSNPPPGWGNPVDRGQLTFVSPDRARFDGFGTAFFRRASGEKPVLCD